jgi:hypothetical protein
VSVRSYEEEGKGQGAQTGIHREVAATGGGRGRPPFDDDETSADIRAFLTIGNIRNTSTQGSTEHERCLREHETSVTVNSASDSLIEEESR